MTLPFVSAQEVERRLSASQGADEMVRIARGHGKAVFTRLREVPGCELVEEPVTR